MSEHTPLTKAEIETLRDACNLSQRHELPMNVCAVVERILAARTSTATADDGLRARIDSAIRLISPGDLTPAGARQLRAALDREDQ